METFGQSVLCSGTISLSNHESLQETYNYTLQDRLYKLCTKTILKQNYSSSCMKEYTNERLPPLDTI